MHHGEPFNTPFVQAGQYSLSSGEHRLSMTHTILGIPHGSVLHNDYQHTLRPDACLACQQEVNAGGQVVREILDRQPQRWRFCSSETLSLQAMGREKFDPAAHEQWSLLDIVH